MLITDTITDKKIIFLEEHHSYFSSQIKSFFSGCLKPEVPCFNNIPTAMVKVGVLTS